MSCMPFQVDANSLAASPHGAVRRSARAITPLCHSRNQPEPYYLQQWSLAGDGGVLRYVPVLNTHHFRCEASNRILPHVTIISPMYTPGINRPSSVPAILPTLVSSFPFLPLSTASSTVVIYLRSQSFAPSPSLPSRLTSVHTSSLWFVTHRTRGSYLCFQLHCPSCCL